MRLGRGLLPAAQPRHPERRLLPLGAGHLESIAQEIEAELRGGAVGDVAAIQRLTLLIGHLLAEDADGQAEGLVNRPHPLGVAASEVVVDGGDVNAFALQGIEEQPAARP